MADEISQPLAVVPDANQSATPVNSETPHTGILNQTLGQLLQNNNQAQGMIMQAMQINPQQFQELLSATGNNQLMNQTIGDLFKNGVVGQAASGQEMQLTPEQFQHIANTITKGQPVQAVPQTTSVGPNDKVPYTIPQAPEQKSFMQKIKNLFK